MATFEQLSADQRAIIELVLQRGQSYDELSDKLGMSESRVRKLAREALVQLAPVTAQRVDEEWRDQLADYVLGQQSGPESTATRGHLRRSEAARSWARSLLDSLDDLYGNGFPAIPDAERGGRKRDRERKPAPAAREEGKPRRSRSRAPERSSAVRRRRLVSALGVLAVILIGVLLWPVGLLTGGDDDEGGARQAASGNKPAASSAKSRGQAIIFERDGKQQMLVSAVGLTPSNEQQAYEAWLFNSAESAKSLGLTVTDQQGRLQGGAALPANYRDYKFVDLSLEPIDENRKHSGRSTLRGVLELLDKPVFQGKGKNRVKVVATISMVPLP